ncbi:1319_t:CDS:2, partial [Gigaspora margarita]
AYDNIPKYKEINRKDLQDIKKKGSRSTFDTENCTITTNMLDDLQKVLMTEPVTTNMLDDLYNTLTIDLVPKPKIYTTTQFSTLG